ncbi:hypothetical protein DPX16_16031 [Anabarilius grahami]|uniref:Uncharacterized protein n=1 Tax=Anabarilius grahami TaxID=495550 RepID=A0A3N0YU39_ANAGA|nr:hypothetical protein DPX16_16031 [Anabarilius grahami]
MLYIDAIYIVFACAVDSWYSPVRSAVYLLGHNVNVQISTRHHYPGVKLFINSCYVATVNTLSQATKYSIIDNYGSLFGVLVLCPVFARVTCSLDWISRRCFLLPVSSLDRSLVFTHGLHGTASRTHFTSHDSSDLSSPIEVPASPLSCCVCCVVPVTDRQCVKLSIKRLTCNCIHHYLRDSFLTHTSMCLQQWLSGLSAKRPTGLSAKRPAEALECQQLVLKSTVDLPHWTATLSDLGQVQKRDVTLEDQWRRGVGLEDKRRRNVALEDQRRRDVTLGDQRRSDVTLGDQRRRDVT